MDTSARCLLPDFCFPGFFVEAFNPRLEAKQQFNIIKFPEKGFIFQKIKLSSWVNRCNSDVFLTLRQS